MLFLSVSTRVALKKQSSHEEERQTHGGKASPTYAPLRPPPDIAIQPPPKTDIVVMAEMMPREESRAPLRPPPDFAIQPPPKTDIVAMAEMMPREESRPSLHNWGLDTFTPRVPQTPDVKTESPASLMRN
jgi:hypothetical protein